MSASERTSWSKKESSESIALSRVEGKPQVNKKWYGISNEKREKTNSARLLKPLNCECAVVQKYHESSQISSHKRKRRAPRTHPQCIIKQLKERQGAAAEEVEKNANQINGQPKVSSLLFYGWRFFFFFCSWILFILFCLCLAGCIFVSRFHSIEVIEIGLVENNLLNCLFYTSLNLQ